MKSAQEVLKSREEKKLQKIKENQEQINKELLAFEKALNKYENDISDDKPYITVDEIIRTDEVKSLLKENGYIIDKVSNDIKINTTRVYLSEKDYDIAIKGNWFLNQINKTPKENFEPVKINICSDDFQGDDLALGKLLKRLGQLHNYK